MLDKVKNMNMRKLKSLLLSIEMILMLVLALCCKNDSQQIEQPSTIPIVKIVMPANNAQIIDSTVIEVDASDDKGVVRVEIYIDNNLDSNRVFVVTPYRYVWYVSLLPDSSTHTIYAKAYDGDGHVSSSRVINVRVIKFPPPSNLVATSLSDSSVALNWNNNSKFETGIEIEQSTDGSNYLNVKTADSNSVSVVLSGTYDRMINYYFRVRAIEGTKHSLYSNVVHIFFDSALYAAGKFEYAGGINVNNIARWNASGWRDVGGGVIGDVYALAVYKNELYVAGLISSAGGVSVNNIAKWNGVNWSAVNEGVNGTVQSLQVYQNELYVAVQSSGVAVNFCTKWNGFNWSVVGNEFNNTIFELTSYDNGLYAGGRFDSVGGTAVKYISVLNGSNWLPVGTGLDSIGLFGVTALTVFNNELYAGGDFIKAGGLNVNRIAKWDGANWSSVGNGMDNNIQALGIYNNSLIAGGWFRHAGGAAVNYIARWDGSSWSDYGTGISSTNIYVFAFVVYDNVLYTGGLFTFGFTNGIAMWNGSSWVPVGLGTDNYVRCLATYAAWTSD